MSNFNFLIRDLGNFNTLVLKNLVNVYGEVTNFDYDKNVSIFYGIP